MGIRKYEEIRLRLLKATSYQEFLQVYCESGVSYSALGKRSGFSSRAYVREIVLGRRRLTLPSVMKFAAGMGLTATWKDYFLHLCALENPEFIQKRTAEEVRARLANIANKLSREKKRHQVENKESEDLADKVLQIPMFPLVFALIAGRETTIDRVAVQVKSSLETVKRSVEKMQALKLLEYDRESGRINGKDTHLSLTHVGKSRLASHFYLVSLDDAKGQVFRSFNSDDKLFHQSYFCVPQDKMQELKKELRELILRFVDENIDFSGDKVARLMVSLY